jgi:hypothetical protein
MQASYRRIGLSFCLDLILFYGLVRWFLFLAGFGMDYGFLVALAVTAFVRAVLHGAVASPGMHMLSIDSQYSVDADVLARESLLTLLLGVALAWSGIEDTLRWMALPWGAPFFGGLPSIELDRLIALPHGALYFAAGWLILRLSRAGCWLGLALSLLDLCSSVLSWNVWEHAVLFWDHGQGRFSQDQIEFLGSFLAMTELVLTLLVMILLTVSWQKFARSAG